MAFVNRKLSALSDASSSTAAALSQKNCNRAALCIARGVVVEQDDSSLVLNCDGWIVRSAHGYVYAGDGVGMDPIYANLVEAHEQFQFGRLMTVDRGVLRQSVSVYDRSMWTTGSYLTGLLMVKGYPTGSISKGKGIKIVVAPDGNALWHGDAIPAYTASFTLTN